MELWDLTACCRFYQTGACSHTEDYGDDDIAEVLAANPPIWGPDTSTVSDSEEPF